MALRSVWSVLSSLFSPTKSEDKEKKSAGSVPALSIMESSEGVHTRNPKPKRKYNRKKKIAMSELQPFLSVFLVVKNETSVIVNSLDSIKPVADEIVVVDTGSSDGTVNLVRKWAAHNKFTDHVEIIEIGNKYHDEEGNFHFGNAKQGAMLECSCDYVMWMDGSDVISDPIKLRQVFRKAYSIDKEFKIQLDTILGTVSFPRNRIFPKNAAKFVYAVHEGAIFTRKLKTIATNVTINHIVKGDRRVSVARNLKILHKEWEKEKTPRTAFYLGNSYMDLKQWDRAIQYFRIRINDFPDDKFVDEVYKSYECICICFRKLISVSKTYSKKFLESAENLYDFRENRRESYFYMGLANGNLGNMREAVYYFEKCMTLPESRLDNYSLWIDPKIYSNKYVHNFLIKSKNSQVRP